MQFRAVVTLAAALAVAVPAAAIYRIDTFAGRGYGDGGPAIAASVIGPADAVTDAAGNVYFSDTGDQLVRRVDAATRFITTVAGNGSPGTQGDGRPAVTASLFDPDGVALDPTERYLYIAEISASRVRRVDLTTGIITTFAGTGSLSTSASDTGDGGPATLARFNEPIGVAVNAAGDVFISERDEDHPSGEPHHPRIRRVDHATGTITLFAGGLDEGYNGEGHPALQTQLADPIGMRFDGAGNLYFGELGNNRIRRIAAGGDHVITTVAGNGAFPEPNDPTKVPFNDEGGPATQASLVRPVRLALVPHGCGGAGAPACQVYFGDSGHHCVRMVDVQGNLHTVVNAPTTPNVTPAQGDSGDGGPGALALLMTPAAVLGPNDTIIVIDDAGNRLRLYDPATMLINAFAGTPEGGFGGDHGPAARALLNRPTGLAVDGEGNVFVSEHDNHRIRRIGNDANRTITTYAGNGSRPDPAVGDGDGGPATAASFDQPTGVAFTPLGDLLVSDAATEKVRRIDHASTIISTFAGTGTAGSGGDGGQATSAQLNTPLRTAVTAAGDVFIADFNNNRIRRVDPSGRISTFASGTLSNPAGLAFGADGMLYVSDFGNERIVAIDSGGAIRTVAGTGVASGSIDGEGGNPSDDRGDGGPAGAATFSDPTGVSFDVDGSLLVADQGNNVVRRIARDASGNISQASIVTTVAGNGQGTYGGDGGASTTASLGRPTEALALADGRILIADRGNQRVRILTPVASICDVSCDDGDPCTADSCDPATGCHHAPSQDSDGDGVCDAVDDCPTVADPNQDKPCPGGGGGGGGGGSGACAAGKPACIPGAGPQATDCLVETVVTGAQGTPLVRCTDGDPACDADPAPGHCGFTVSMCFNNSDPRLACIANGVARVAVRATMKPHAAARGLVSSVIGAVTHVAGGSPRGAKIVFAQPLTTANLCTQAMTAEVSVRGRPGHERPGKGVLALTAKAAGRGRDVDQIRLVCVPAK